MARFTRSPFRWAFSCWSPCSNRSVTSASGCAPSCSGRSSLASGSCWSASSPSPRPSVPHRQDHLPRRSCAHHREAFFPRAGQLLNVLQLRELAGSAGDNALIEASISQKVDELRPVLFVAAVNLRENRRYLRYAALPLAVLLVLLFAAPSLITDSTKRLIEHRTYFEKPAPFQFVVENKSLRAIQQEDFRLDVRIEGKEIPAEASIELDGKLFRLEKNRQRSSTTTSATCNNRRSSASRPTDSIRPPTSLKPFPNPRS